MPNLSVVIPVYRAAPCLPELVRRLDAALTPLVDDYEIVLVDDRSPDDSWAVIQQQATANPKVVGLRLSRNFGQHRAIGAGLARARGDFVVVMDCDLQDPPEAIASLVAASDDGADIVYVRRRQRRDGLFKRLTSWVFFQFVRLLSGRYLLPGTGSFSLIRRKVADAYLRVADEHSHYLITLYWLGFDTVYVDVEQAARFAGESSYSLRKLVVHALDGIVSQSTRLLHISIYAGFAFAGVAVVQVAYLVVRKLAMGYVVPGWASLMASVWFIGGVVLFSLGIIGLYLERIFQRSQGRPLFVVDESTEEGQP